MGFSVENDGKKMKKGSEKDQKDFDRRLAGWEDVEEVDKLSNSKRWGFFGIS